MTLRALTITNLLKSMVLSSFNFTNKQCKDCGKSDVFKYKLIKKFSLNSQDSPYMVGIFSNATGKKVVIKRLLYKFKDLSYWHLINEANILKILKNRKVKLKRKIYSIAKLIKFHDDGQYLTLFTKYHQGKKLSKLDSNSQGEILDGVLTALKKITSELKESESSLIPRRTPFHMLVSFPYFLLRSILKDTVLYRTYLKLGTEFFKNYLNIKIIFSPKYYLSHRDLHEDNILIHKNEVTVLDPGFLVFWEKHADLAIIAYKYINHANFSSFRRLLQKNLVTKDDWKRFHSLLIYYLIQSLAVTSLNSPDYGFAKNYLNNDLNVFEVMSKKNH